MDTALTHTQSQAAETLQGIMALERSMRDMPQVECPLEHYFPEGMYARKISVPAGTVLTSKVHKTEHLSVLLRGKLSVVSEDGAGKVIEAPAVFVTHAHTKRAVYIHDDVVFMTVHRCDARTLEGAEEELVWDVDTVEEYSRLTGKVPELEAV